MAVIYCPIAFGTVLDKESMQTLKITINIINYLKIYES